MNTATKQTILCVDDDALFLRFLEAYLSPQGYKLQFSESGEDALEKIAKETPDLILLDIMMPGMSGMDVLRRVRSDERTGSIPVAFLTSKNTGEDKIRGIALGCDDFISKPFSMIDLIVRVRSLLKIRLDPGALGEHRLWRHNGEMSRPMIVCNPNWIITNLNSGAQRYLMPGQGFENVNFLDFIFKHYSVSVSRNQLNHYAMAPQTFRIEKKNFGVSLVQRAEVSLEVFENPVHETTEIVLMLRDMMDKAEKIE